MCSKTCKEQCDYHLLNGKMLQQTVIFINFLQGAYRSAEMFSFWKHRSLKSETSTEFSFKAMVEEKNISLYFSVMSTSVS